MTAGWRSSRPAGPQGPGRRRRSCALVALALLFALASPAGAQTGPVGTPTGPAPASPAPASPAPVSLTGRVVNGTTGTTIPAQLSVTGTEVNAQATSEVASASGHMAADGTFRIDGLPSHSGDRYVVSADYNGVTYVAASHPPDATTLTIYETTTDATVLSIPSDTLTVFPGKAGTYDAFQLLHVKNSSNRTYIGQPDPAGTGLRQALKLPVPKGIQNFAAESGLTDSGLSVSADGQVASADPVLPGDSTVSYLYQISVARSGWPLSRAVIYPTARVALLVDPALRASGPGLTLARTVPVGNQQYQDYEGGALAPGTKLTADIVPVTTTSISLWLGLLALVTVLAAAGLVISRLISRRRERAEAAAREARRKASEAEWDEDGEPARGERERLIRDIAALDEAHQAGEVSDDTYATRRSRLKERLTGLEAPDGPDTTAGPELS